jgi:catechol 2,3-dioxygenase
MPKPPRPHFSHVGIHVYDIDRMIDFYTGLLGLELTDRGKLNIPGQPQIAFLSSDPEEHHQIALAEGRNDAGIEAVVLNQISFSVDDLGALRQMKAAAEELGVEQFLPLNHGNAWSIYFKDPEGNAIEVFTRSPFHVRQPVTDGLDLSQSDEEILASTERTYADAEDFGPAVSWREAFIARLEARWKGQA